MTTVLFIYNFDNFDNIYDDIDLIIFKRHYIFCILDTIVQWPMREICLKSNVPQLDENKYYSCYKTKLFYSSKHIKYGVILAYVYAKGRQK